MARLCNVMHYSAIGYLMFTYSVLALHLNHELPAARASNATCKPDQYGQDGRWVDSGTTIDWEDKQCGILPQFNVERFCSELLQCKHVLIVGDSTSGQFFEVMGEALHREGLPNARLKDTSMADSLNTPLNGLNHYQTRTVPPGDYFFEGCKEPRRYQVCQDSCPKGVTITSVRHDHLNGPGYSWNKKSACAWHNELNKHAWVVLSYGTHVNDHEDLLLNRNNVLEKRAADLFQLLKQKHPNGIIWRTAYYGLDDIQTRPCPNRALVKAAPLTKEQISVDKFNGSWRKIAELNEIYKRAIQAAGLPVVLLDVEKLFSMRPDCRADFIHYDWGNYNQSIAGFYPRMLQFFMTHLSTNMTSL